MDSAPARAFAPAVPRALARHGFAPAATDAARLLADAASSAVSERLAAEEASPEDHAPDHVYFADPQSGSPDFGAAPSVLAEAWSSLAEAYRADDPATIGRSVAAIAVAAADLADPFRTSGPARAGFPGARARFCDLLDETEATAWIEGAPALSPAPLATRDEVEAAGRRLAGERAAQRDAIEACAEGGREAEFAALRRSRLEAASSLVRALVAGARAAAPTRASSGGESRGGPFLVLPNPAPARAAIVFRAPAAGTARVLVVDPSGRRVAEFTSPIAAPGAVTIALDPWLPTGLAPGAYFARVTAPGAEGVARFVRIAR